MMTDTSYDQPAGSIHGVENQVAEVIGIMKDNVTKVIDRGEKLEDIEERAAILECGTKQFQQNSSRVRKKMWIEHMRTKILMVVVIGAIVIFIAVILYLVLR